MEIDEGQRKEKTHPDCRRLRCVFLGYCLRLESFVSSHLTM